MVGVDRSAVTKWRRGAIRPDWPSLAKICNATKGAVTPNDFLHPDFKSQQPADINHATPSASRAGWD
jgi:transcriptional regulator with XRE-family HTH domain